MSAVATAEATVVFTPEALSKWEEFRAKVSSALADDEVKSSFEGLSTFLQNSTTLKAAFELLNASRCSLLEKPSPRTLLASLMLALFPTEIIEMDEAELQRVAEADPASLDAQCWQAAKALVHIFDDGAASLRTLLEALSHFQDVFSRWKVHDRERLLRHLGNSHHQWTASLRYLEESRDTATHVESVDVMVAEVTKQLEANKRRILQIGGPTALEEILANPPLEVRLDEIVQEEASRRYWQEFAEELRAEPPVYTRVVALLTELRDRLAALLPHRADLQQEILTAIDVAFVQQMMEAGVFDGGQFLDVFSAIWAQIKALQAAADDSAWTAFRDDVEQQCRAANVTWDALLPSVFNRFLTQLDRVEQATAHYRANLQVPRPTSS